MRTTSALLAVLLPTLATTHALAQDSEVRLTSWQQAVDSWAAADSKTVVDAILRHYPGAYCDAIQERAPRMHCVGARMSQEADRIFDTHQSMRERIGWAAYAQLWTDPSTGIRDEFQTATKLTSGSFILGTEACFEAATNDTERQACRDRMGEANEGACLAGATTEEERQACRDDRDRWEQLKQARSRKQAESQPAD